MSETQDSTPVVQKKALIPPGVLPRNAQAWFIAGISILMILVIAFSGSKQPKEKLPAKTPTSQGADPNEQRIQEYRARIGAQAQKLLAEQADLARAKQAFGIPINGPVPSQPPAYAGPDGQAPFPYERAPVSEK